MSTVIDAPLISPPEKKTSSTGSIEDEKFAYNEKGTDVIETVDLADPGDVFEDVRAIDLDENGKERPIGTLFPSHFLYLVG
jgi:hypothetical protein